METYSAHTGRSTRYGQRALDSETAKIIAAPHGGRHPQIFRSACSIFRLAAGGEIDEGLAYAELLAAGIAVGKPEREVRRILKGARARGFQEPRRAPDTGRYTGINRGRRPMPEPPQRAIEPDYQRREVLDAIFAQGISVLADPCVDEWLHWRDIDSKIVASEGLASSLPSSGTYPKDHVPWVNFEGEWMPGPVAGVRLLVPFYDVFGERRGGELVRACVEPPLPAAKSLALRGARARLVMTNPIALGLLRGEDVSSKTIVITEGVPDFLTASVENPKRAVFGIVQGSWKPRYAALIPHGADIIVATDNDDAGQALAAAVVKTLEGRQYRRWRPRGIMPNGEPKKDVNDCGGIGGGVIEWNR